ncbi:MAG: periplasmic heavy metal sensor [Calditrichales bacterium]|nr:MAG: periplasmic heavy metal sensor [Calditrichales bacterium]
MYLQKIILTLFTLSLILYIGCSDQGEGRRQFSPQEQAATLQKELGLSTEQTAAIEKIYTAHFQKMRETREQMRGDRDQMRTAMREMRDNLNTEIESQLTEEQTSRYREYLQAREDRRGGDHRRPE